MSFPEGYIPLGVYIPVANCLYKLMTSKIAGHTIAIGRVVRLQWGWIEMSAPHIPLWVAFAGTSPQ